MSDKELQNTINHLRRYTFDERQKESKNEKLDVFFINIIDIACNLTELGLTQKREISKEERYWFEGSYHMNFWNSDIEDNFYTPLCREVEKRNWFKKVF